MTTTPITASVGEPKSLPERPTMYSAMWPDGSLTRATTDKAVIDALLMKLPPGSILVTIPGSAEVAAAKGEGKAADPKCKLCIGLGKYWWNHPNDGPQEVVCECVAQPTPSVGSGEEVAWLIERGQPEGQCPPCWLKCNGSQDGYEWVYDANEATKYRTKHDANAALVARSGIASVHSRWGHVTEHVFISQPSPTPDLRAVVEECLRMLTRSMQAHHSVAVMLDSPEDVSPHGMKAIRVQSTKYANECHAALTLARTALNKPYIPTPSPRST